MDVKSNKNWTDWELYYTIKLNGKEIKTSLSNDNYFHWDVDWFHILGGIDDDIDNGKDVRENIMYAMYYYLTLGEELVILDKSLKVVDKEMFYDDAGGDYLDNHDLSEYFTVEKLKSKPELIKEEICDLKLILLYE